MPPTTPLATDLDPARAGSQASPDALVGPLAKMLRDLDDSTLVEAAMPWLTRRLSTLVPSLITTRGAGRALGPGDELAGASRPALDAPRATMPELVVPVPHEAAAGSPGSPAAASSTEGGASAQPRRHGERREQICAYVVAHGPVSSTQVADHFGLGHSTVPEHLRALVAKGAIAVGTAGPPWTTRYAGTQDAASEAARSVLHSKTTARPTRAPATGMRPDERGTRSGFSGPASSPSTDAARRTAIGRGVSVPAPGTARGPLTEPPKRHRSLGA